MWHENLTGTYITGKTIVGGRIESDTTIDVETTININTPSLGGITFGSGGSILRDPSGDINIFANRYINMDAVTGYAFSGGEMLMYVDKLGFFSSSPVVQQSATLLGSKVTTETADTTYSQNEVDMLDHLKADIQSVYSKIDGILKKLGDADGYGLFKIT